MTGALVLVVAASLLVYSIHELYEVGAFDALRGTGLLEGVPIISGIVNVILQPIVGLGGGRTWLEVIAFFGYLLIVGPLFFRPARPAPVPPGTPAAPSTQAKETATTKS